MRREWVTAPAFIADLNRTHRLQSGLPGRPSPMNTRYHLRLVCELAEIVKRIEATKAPECVRLASHFPTRAAHLRARLEEARTARA